MIISNFVQDDPFYVKNGDQALPADERELECGQICMSLWKKAWTNTWYISYCTEVLSDEFRVEHIHRITKGSNLKWRYCISLILPLLNLTKSLIVWLMVSGTYLVTEIVNFYSKIMKQSIGSSWMPCRHFLMHKSSLLTIHIYFLAVVFILLLSIW